MSLPILLRPFAASDAGLVFNSWLKSYANSAWANLIPTGRLYWERHHEVVDRLVRTARVVVACWEEDPDLVAGWACFQEDAQAVPILHYVYVRERFRRKRLAAALLGQAAGSMPAPPDRLWSEQPIRYTHRSRVCSELPIPPSWVYDPYAMFPGPGG
jgi:GNAT superfamily N-acetyltransferase